MNIAAAIIINYSIILYTSCQEKGEFNVNSKNNKMELLGNAPIPKALMAMGIPTMLGMMVNAIYNLVDAYFVGGLGTSQMGAISVVYPLGQVVVGLGLLFGNGAASYLSRLLGNGDKEKADKVASTALYSRCDYDYLFRDFSSTYFKTIRSDRQYPALCYYLCQHLYCFVHI